MHGWIRYSLELVSSGGGGGGGRRGERDRGEGEEETGSWSQPPTSCTAFFRLPFFCIPLPPDSRPSLYYPAFRLIGSENHTWRKRYKIQEIFHDCGHAAIWKTRNPTRLWLYTDMKDKKSYTTVDIHRYERRDILQGCGYIEGLCRSLLKVRWYKTIKGAVWL